MNREKPLRLPSLLALGINGIVGVGIFFAPREVAAVMPGWRGVFAYVAVTLLLLPTGLVFARLGRPCAAVLMAHSFSGSTVSLPISEAPGKRLLAAALPVVFALQGFEVVPLPAAQVEDPKRNVALATVGSLLFAGALYVALHASCLL